MTSFRFEKSGGLGIVTFDGELTAEFAGRLKEALMVSLDNAEHVVINCERVTKIDRICMHLLSLACRKSKRLKKRITLTGIHPETYGQIEMVQVIAG